MAKLGVDVSKVASPFSPVPEGNYTAKVTKAELTQSKKGNPMLAMEYEIVGHPEMSGRKLFNYLVLDNQSGKFGIHQHALAAGDDPQDPDPDTWINSTFDCEVSVEEGDRGPQNRVQLLIDVTHAPETVTL